MESYDRAYYLDRIEIEQKCAREADNVLVAGVHAELAKEYQRRIAFSDRSILSIVSPA